MEAAAALLGIAALLVAARYVYVMFIEPMSAFDKPRTTTTPQTADARPTVKPGETPEPTPEPTPTLSPEEQLRAQADLDFMKNKVNILMLGWDESPERDDEDSELYRDENNNFRSDVLMLATIDFEKKTVDLISVPRDTYAPIYNTKGRWKINAAFAKGGSAEGDGFEYAMKTVSNLLGVPIDITGREYGGAQSGGGRHGRRGLRRGRAHHTQRPGARKGLPAYGWPAGAGLCARAQGHQHGVGRADRQQRMLFAIFDQLKAATSL
jgi:anionic cell wall polymer biosynthesis LytR-Cps2A-Psr (LCP) family protein